MGLETNGEDIDALGFTADGRLIVSTTGSFSVPGVSGKDEDLIAFTPTQLGETTSGVWEMYLDGSDVGLADASTEDIDAVWIDPVSSQIYLSAVGAFGVTGASGDGVDVFICAPGLLGSTSICTFGPGVYWDGSANGFAGQVIDGFDLVRQ